MVYEKKIVLRMNCRVYKKPVDFIVEQQNCCLAPFVDANCADTLKGLTKVFFGIKVCNHFCL
jgi:hypothetical protein